MHFDHERVPERAVHARGAGAHGTFVSYGDYSNITGASFLGSSGKKTPIFMRFSTVAGSRGSADTVRDVHGFAVRWYTDEGNFGTLRVLIIRVLLGCVLLLTIPVDRYCWKQYSGLLHPRCNQISRSDPCRQAKTRF